MRHYKKGRKLGTDASHTKAMKKSLVGALLENDRIKTTETRAKEIRPEVDRVITWAKKGDLHSRRLAIAKVGDQELVRELFEKVAQGMFADRPGGYTRIMKLGPRKGDKAPMVIMELVTEPVKAKKGEAVPAKAASAKTAKPASKKADEAVEEKKAEEAVATLEAAEDADAAEAAAEEARSAEAAGDTEVVAEEKAEEAVESLDAAEEAEKAEAAAEEAKTE